LPFGIGSKESKRNNSSHPSRLKRKRKYQRRKILQRSVMTWKRQLYWMMRNNIIRNI